MGNSTGPRPNSDTDYGVVGDKTLRTAAQIGNETGQADYGKDISTDQTLRVALSTDSEVSVLSPWHGVVHFDERPAVPIGTETKICSYTSSATFRPKMLTASGEADAIFNFKIDGQTVARRRNNWTQRNVKYDLKESGIELTLGEEVSIHVVSRGETAVAFDGTIYGEEK